MNESTANTLTADFSTANTRRRDDIVKKEFSPLLKPHQNLEIIDQFKNMTLCGARYEKENEDLQSVSGTNRNNKLERNGLFKNS